MQRTWVSALIIMLGFATFAHAQPNISAGKAKAQQICQACHGTDGDGISPMYPKLASQSAEYLNKQLADFKSGTRKDPIMSPMAAGLSPSDLRNLAAYYASLTIKLGVAVGDKNTIDLGKKIYRGGNAKTGVSACMSCHGPSGHGIPPRFPRVSGQHATYTQKQLLMFKNASRSNDNDVMTRITFRMSETEIKAVSEYMAGLK